MSSRYETVISSSKQLELVIHEHLKFLEGVKSKLKILHWNADSMHTHKLCDDVTESVNGYQDSIAEYAFGLFNFDMVPKISKIQVNSFYPTKFDVDNLFELLELIKESVLSVRMKIELIDETEFIGIFSICDGFMENVVKFIYLNNMD